MSQKGIVFNIQRFSLNDGNGIRTLVFMKGCPLHCLWCSNPEGISPRPTLSYNELKCFGCGQCARICPAGAIRMEDGKSVWNKEKCVECLRCASVCLSHARDVCGREYTADELAKEVTRDSLFYNISQGGVTMGGGEPLQQAPFVGEFLRLCRAEHGMHTAIETSAYAPWEQARQVFENVDLFLIDIKHMDPDVHRTLTGVSNDLILDNLTRISQSFDFSRRELIVRIPVIPTLNASIENIRATAAFVKGLGVVKRLDLLPYHALGRAKYDRFRISGGYRLDRLGDSAPAPLLKELKELVEAEGLTVRVGG